MKVVVIAISLLSVLSLDFVRPASSDMAVGTCTVGCRTADNAVELINGIYTQRETGGVCRIVARVCSGQ